MNNNNYGNRNFGKQFVPRGGARREIGGRNSAMPQAKVEPFKEVHLDLADSTYDFKRSEEKRFFLGSTGATFIAAEPKMLTKFGEKGVRDVVTGDEVFTEVAPVQEEVVDQFVDEKEARIVDTFVQKYLQTCYLHHVHMMEEDIPLDGDWPDFHADYNVPVARVRELEGKLQEVVNERADRLFKLEDTRAEREVVYEKKVESYRKRLEKWDEKVDKCVDLWNVMLGDAVLKQVRAELSARNMPAVLDRLRAIYGGVAEGDREGMLLEKVQNIVYLPSKQPFDGFVKDLI
jgi:hypothetical protein